MKNKLPLKKNVFCCFTYFNTCLKNIPYNAYHEVNRILDFLIFSMTIKLHEAWDPFI